MKRQITSLIIVMAMIVGMFSFGTMSVGAAVGDPPAGITFDGSTESFKVSSNNAGTYLYALKYDVNNPSKARWFPLYGDLNVSKLIPKKAPQAGREVRVAFRVISSIAAVATPNTLADAGGVVAIELKVRGSELKKNDLAYFPMEDGGKIAKPQMSGTKPDMKASPTSISALAGTDYAILVGKLGENNWVKIGATTAVEGLAAKFPMGGNVEIKIASATDLTVTLAGTGTSMTPNSSNSLKIRIPAIPKAPRVNAPRYTAEKGTGTSLASATNIITVNDKMEYKVVSSITSEVYSASPSGWTSLPTKTATEDVKGLNLFGTDVIVNGKKTAVNPSASAGQYIVVRLKGTEKNPPSMYSFYLVTAADTQYRAN